MTKNDTTKKEELAIPDNLKMKVFNILIDYAGRSNQNKLHCDIAFVKAFIADSQNCTVEIISAVLKEYKAGGFDK